MQVPVLADAGTGTGRCLESTEEPFGT